MQQDQNRSNDRVGQDLDVIPLSFAASSSTRGESQSGLDIMFDLHVRRELLFKLTQVHMLREKTRYAYFGCCSSSDIKHHKEE